LVTGGVTLSSSKMPLIKAGAHRWGVEGELPDLELGPRPKLRSGGEYASLRGLKAGPGAEAATGADRRPDRRNESWSPMAPPRWRRSEATSTSG